MVGRNLAKRLFRFGTSVKRMSTAERPTLSRELIAQTALELTDKIGLDKLSMRKLGAELGVEAMSLYHYVDSKDDLLNAVLDGLYQEIDLPIDSEDVNWEVALREGLTAFRDVLLKHPAALELFSSRPALTPTALDVLLWAYNRFEASGLSPTESTIAFRYAVSFVIGHAADELGISAFTQGNGEIDISSLGDPRHRELLEQRNHLTSDEVFAGGLDLVVAGLRSVYKALP